MLPDPRRSTRSIRLRLFWLLGQAFLTVVLSTLGLTIFSLSLALSRSTPADPFFPPSALAVLESYYLGRGSWAGVESLLVVAGDEHSIREVEWDSVVVLDRDKRVVLDSGRADTSRIGQEYVVGDDEVYFLIQVNGQTVGTLILARPGVSRTTLVIFSAMPLFVIVSFFTGIITMLIGYQLGRRIVNPLAEVIAAAQAVSQGDLSARVSVHGSGDVRALSDSFNRMATNLEKNDQERRNFLADIAHELRTPLTVLRGRLEGIVDGIYPADESHIVPVLEETYVLENLVEDLRLLTLAEARQLVLDTRPVDLGELANRAVSLFEAEAADKEITITVTVADPLPQVPADPQRMGQVIGNLISNGLRYVPAGGQIEVFVRPGNQAVELIVSDNGSGVAENDLPYLFDRFWRADKSRGRALGGAGLGLAIARQLIEAHGGQIWAMSRPGGGLSVTFCLNTTPQIL